MTVSSPSSPILDRLTSTQQQAVQQISGPLLVLAGAGSGKTRVLTHKIAYMIESGIAPSQILAVTFTNKAAREMTARLESLIGRAESAGIWVGTFHSICGRLLRRDISRYTTETQRQWHSNFVIYDESDSISAVKAAIRQLDLDEKLYVPKSIKYQISSLKNQLISPYQYASQAVNFKAEKMACIYDAYEAILATNNALDFDDLLQKAVEIMQRDAMVRERYYRQFAHVLVDEFQDTNDAQYELVRLIVEGDSAQERGQNRHEGLWKNRSFTVVGDVDQSIYSWRGANFKILLNFQKDFPEAGLVKLEHNYRSTGNILRMANEIIDNNQERLPKSLICVKGDGEKIHCYEAKDDRDEAFFVLDRFQQLIEQKGYRPGDCCILYRTNFQSRMFEDVLISRGLPYTIIGGLKFYERREIKDLIAYLNVVFNDQDAYSVKRVLLLERGLGKAALEKLEAYAQQEGMSLYEALKRCDQVEGLSAVARKAAGRFVALIEDLKQKNQTLPPTQLIHYLIEASGYVEELKRDDPLDSEGRVQNIEELVSVTAQYEMESPEADLGGFLTQMSLLTDLDSSEAPENKFVLMTMHGAKGLEFPVVAIVGLEEGLFPHARSLSDKPQMEEERRLMYVAVTRAEDNLIITYARRRMVFGELKYATPSRFLKEAPSEVMSGIYTLDQDAVSPRGPQDRYSRDRDDWSDEPPSWQQRSLGKSEARPTARKLSAPSSSGVSSRSHIPAAPVRLLDVGDRVSHSKFGLGTIDQVIGEGEKAVYSVKFDTIAGKKLLDPKFAKLDPI